MLRHHPRKVALPAPLRLPDWCPLRVRVAPCSRRSRALRAPIAPCATGSLRAATRWPAATLDRRCARRGSEPGRDRKTALLDRTEKLKANRSSALSISSVVALDHGRKTREPGMGVRAVVRMVCAL